MTLNDTFVTMKSLTDRCVDQMTSLGELNMSLLDRLTAKQMAAVDILMEQGHRTLTLATGAKGYHDFLKGQVDAGKEWSDRWMAESKAGLVMAGTVRDEYKSLFEKNLVEVKADLRKLAPSF